TSRSAASSPATLRRRLELSAANTHVGDITRTRSLLREFYAFEAATAGGAAGAVPPRPELASATLPGSVERRTAPTRQPGPRGRIIDLVVQPDAQGAGSLRPRGVMVPVWSVMQNVHVIVREIRSMSWTFCITA